MTESDVLEKEDTFVVEGLDEPVICQAEDESGPCTAEADWVSRTVCCGTAWTMCDEHRDVYLIRAMIFDEEWACGVCHANPMPGVTWERL